MARAQGVQTGTITGIVQSSDGLSLPGVAVTATSPALQGQRTAVTDVNGVYFIKGLPAGIYSVTFDIPSFQAANTDNITLTVGGVAVNSQYSQKTFEFMNAGGTKTEITASPSGRAAWRQALHPRCIYAAPFFSSLDPEERNNKQFTGSVSYTVSTKSAGTHDVKGGGEYYRATHTGGNSQSATNYVFQADYLVAGGAPVVDANRIPILQVQRRRVDVDDGASGTRVSEQLPHARQHPPERRLHPAAEDQRQLRRRGRQSARHPVRLRRLPGDQRTVVGSLSPRRRLADYQRHKLRIYGR